MSGDAPLREQAPAAAALLSLPRVSAAAATDSVAAAAAPAVVAPAAAIVSRASAPGKLILFGEHAVVYGHTAVAGALSDLRVFACCELLASGRLALGLPAGPGGAALELSWPLADVASALRGSALTVAAAAGSPAVRPDVPLLAALEALLANADASSSSPPAPGGGAGDVRKALAPALFLAAGIFAHELFADSGVESGVVDAGTLALRGLRLAVTGASLPIAAGLGSSAAVSVALAAALLEARRQFRASQLCAPSGAVLDLDLINAWAFGSEMLFHGSPSGLDNSVATFGGALAYSKQPAGAAASGAVSLERVAHMPGLRILVCNTHTPKETSKLVAGVRALRDALPAPVTLLLSACHAIAVEALSAFDDNFRDDGSKDAGGVSGAGARAGAGAHAAGAATPVGATLYTRMRRLVTLNHGVLNALGVGHASLERVVEAAARRGFAAKLTGAGGGGCALVLLPPLQQHGANAGAGEVAEERHGEQAVASLVLELEQQGCSCFETRLGGEGVRLESNSG